MNQKERLEITISCLREEIDGWQQDWEVLHKKDEDGTITEQETERMFSLVQSMEKCRSVLEHFEEKLRILNIREEEENWTPEKEHEADQLAHSEVTLELEQGRDIPLAEWARINGVDPANARQRAIRGTLPARKVGNIWMINEFQKNNDARRR